MSTSWFADLFGFSEGAYDDTKEKLEVVGTTLRSKVNQRSYAIGMLSTPSVRELRERAAPLLSTLSGTLSVSNISGDVRRMHANPAHRHALFQVASQFNLLEMTGPDVTPEQGVTRYAHDRTQGPACALAAGAATVYRNYLAPTEGGTGQTRDRQIDCLRDVGVALGNVANSLWEMRNGYALCTKDGLAAIAQELESLDDDARNGLRDRLRIGLHAGVQVTDVENDHLVSQAFCSALPVAYSNIPAEHWAPFADLVLEGAYEATVWAAVINAHQTGSNLLFLTRLGGGAFGNEPEWIHQAMRRALPKVIGVGLDVRIVSYGRPDAALESLLAEFR